MSDQRLVAFLRAINVGGHNVTMSALRGHFTELGLKDVETFIASGNVMFRAPSRGASTLERRIEQHLEKTLGYEVKTFLRTAEEVAEVASYQAFSLARVKIAKAHCVGFLAEPLDAAGRKTLAALTTEMDEFHVHGREVYWLCKIKQDESRFSNVVFERTVRARATFRSLTTVTKLAALLS